MYTKIKICSNSIFQILGQISWTAGGHCRDFHVFLVLKLSDDVLTRPMEPRMAFSQISPPKKLLRRDKTFKTSQNLKGEYVTVLFLDAQASLAPTHVCPSVRP